MLSKIKASTGLTPERAERIATLSELCTEAAKHVAQARIALFGEKIDTDGALNHLDEAIFCLQRLSAHGRTSGLDGSKAKLRSA